MRSHESWVFLYVCQVGHVGALVSTYSELWIRGGGGEGIFPWAFPLCHKLNKISKYLETPEE